MQIWVLENFFSLHVYCWNIYKITRWLALEMNPRTTALADETAFQEFFWNTHDFACVYMWRPHSLHMKKHQRCLLWKAFVYMFVYDLYYQLNFSKRIKWNQTIVGFFSLFRTIFLLHSKRIAVKCPFANSSNVLFPHVLNLQLTADLDIRGYPVAKPFVERQFSSVLLWRYLRNILIQEILKGFFIQTMV